MGVGSLTRCLSTQITAIVLATSCISCIVHAEEQCVPPSQTLRSWRVAQLSPECKALVEMANPPDSYEVYTTAISAAAISTQIKTIEAKLGLQARTMCPACPVVPRAHALHHRAQTDLQSAPSQLPCCGCGRADAAFPYAARALHC